MMFNLLAEEKFLNTLKNIMTKKKTLTIFLKYNSFYRQQRTKFKKND